MHLPALKALQRLLERCSNPQPPPTAPNGTGEVVIKHLLSPGDGSGWDLVGQAIQQRAERGKEAYGQYLHTHNGRDHVADCAEELLDAMVYLTAARLEGLSDDDKLAVRYLVTALGHMCL